MYYCHEINHNLKFNNHREEESILLNLLQQSHLLAPEVNNIGQDKGQI